MVLLSFSSEINAFLCISETLSCCMLPYWIFMLFVLRIVFYNSQNFAHFPSFGVLCSLEKIVFKKKIRANFKYIKNNYSLVILQLQHRSGRKSFFGLPPTPGWGKKIWSVSYPWLGKNLWNYVADPVMKGERGVILLGAYTPPRLLQDSTHFPTHFEHISNTFVTHF